MTQTLDPAISTNRAVIWSYRLDGAGGGKQQDGYPATQSSENGFNWLHLRSDDSESIKYMRGMNLNPKMIEALSANETRPRMQLLEDGVLINLRGVNTNPGADPEDMVSIRLWFNDSIIISARKRERKLLSIEDLRELIEEGKGPRSPGQFVALLVEKLANRINDVVDSIDDELTGVETGLDEKWESVRHIQQKLSTIRKQTAIIRRYLAPQREALAELYRSAKYLTEDDCHTIRYQNDRIIHYVEDLDLARERALVLHGELQNRIAEQQNSRTYLLSIVATIFLPLSFLTGVFGMNVAGMPGLENPDAFSILSAGMAFLGALLVGYIWWKKWL
ncbi:MAG: zinc transporter ZntB [Gammaproteobacteria bacterium]|nr:zinc transporter ZntB [Gammaproteobacteria bacterium]